MALDCRRSEDLMRKLEKVKLDMTGNRTESCFWPQRQELQDTCRSLLLADLEVGLDARVEHDLWNLAFHPQIKFLQAAVKKSRGSAAVEGAQANLSLFLDFALGFYMQLLQELAAKFCIDVPFHACGRWLGVVTDISVETQSLAPPQAYICQYCLCHLGDISRYRHQHRQAGQYYQFAAQLRPCNGHPYRQLGVLAVAEDQPLEAVLYYCKSLCVLHPFTLTDCNLTALLAKYSSLEGLEVTFTNGWLTFLSCALRAIKSDASSSEDIDDITPLLHPNVEDHITSGNANVGKDLLCVAVSSVYILIWLRPNDSETSLVREGSDSCWQQASRTIMGVFDMLASHLKTRPTLVLPAVSVFIQCLTLNWSGLSFLLPNNIISSIVGYLGSLTSPPEARNPLLEELDGFLLKQGYLSAYSHPDTCYEVLNAFCEQLVRLDDRRVHCNVNGVYVYHEPRSSLLADTFSTSALGSAIRQPSSASAMISQQRRSVQASAAAAAA
eukprot:scpid78446/ scgid16320/ Protein SMG7; EST1-like protein C; SMG-7 homolog